MNTASTIAPGRIRQPRLLPIFVGVAGIALALKVGGFANDLNQLMASAQAQDAGQAETGEGAVAAEGSESSAEAGGASPADQSSDSDDDRARSSTELSLIADLRARRAALEERENRLELREQLLASTEQRIDGKLEELRGIQSRLETLVAQHEEQEDDQIRNIVKVYEAMRPKDAGPIFQRLDLDIQVAVATRMKEANMAAVLAEMTPEAAKTLTSRLARRTPLPDAAALAAENVDESS